MSHSEARLLKALEKIANMAGGPPFQPREVLMRKITREAVASITESSPTPPSTETAADNAALIAAIPEMVATLERMVLVFQPFTSRPVGAPNSLARLEQEEQKSAHHAARAVLQKVKQP